MDVIVNKNIWKENKMNAKEILEKRNDFIDEIEGIEEEIENLADALYESGFNGLSDKLRRIERKVVNLNYHFQEIT